MDSANGNVSPSAVPRLDRPVRSEEPAVLNSIQPEGGFHLPVGTVTLLLTDVEGSTRSWERDPEAMARATGRLDEIIAEVIGRHRGVRPAEQGEGDSSVAAFSRASDAVACALQLQRAVHSEPWPAEGAIRLRIGVHTGEVQVRDDANYTGQAVNRCARLRDIAHGGQTVVSRATHDLVVDRLPEGVPLRDLGIHRLKDLARPEHVFQVDHPDLPADYPPLRSLDALPNNLPVQLTSFVGRERELEEGIRLLRDARLLTVTGSGGCGKTRLALQLAARALEDYRDGAWWVDLAPLTDPALVPSAVAAALSVREVPMQPLTTAIVERVTDRSLLLVLDNCEHMVAACAELSTAVLRGSAGVTIVGTSREPLGVEGEAVWRIPSLTVPTTTAQGSLEALSQYEAVRLFVERATRARPNFTVTNENAPAVAEICHRLDGIPLAIELAAARTRTLAPERILAGLADRFRLLTGGARTALPRQQTLEASVDWSYELLSEEERTLFRRLSLFPGSFTLDAAEEVCSEDGIDRYRVLELVSQLVDRSLIQPEGEDGGPGRYRLLETIRHYGRQKQTQTNERTSLLDRLLSFCVSFVREAAAAFEGPGLTSWLDRVDLELDNLRAAMDWAVESDQATSALRLVGGLGPYWWTRGRWSEARVRFDAALSMGEAEPETRADALTAAAGVALQSLELPTARSFAEQAVALAGELADDRLLGRGLIPLAYTTDLGGEGDAIPLFEEAIAAARRADDRPALSLGLSGAGNSLMIHGRLREARQRLDEALAVAAEVGDPYTAQVALAWLAWATVLQGDFPEAERCATEVLRIARELGGPFFAAEALQVLGTLETRRGAFDRAKHHLEEALEIAQEARNPYLVMLSLWELGLLALTRDEAWEAFTTLEQAVSMTPSLGMGWARMLQLAALGEAALAKGDAGAARAPLEESMALARTPNGAVYNWSRAATLHALGRLDLEQGDETTAEMHLHDALAIYVDGDLVPFVADCLEDLAGLAARDESFAEAIRLFAAAASLRERLGFVRPPYRQAGYDSDLRRAQEGLGAEPFEDTWAEGARLPLGEAVAYARRGRGKRKRPSTGWRSLTPAELNVVRLVAEGSSNREIAERLFISPGTVKAHLSHIFAKLGMSSRAEVAAEAVRRGIEVG